MKKYLFKYLFFLIIITKAYYASSQESSAESSNPFNELMRPQNGIDLFSGAAAINYPFFKLKGINDLDITVKLRYSSNVYINARADNENAATGWCGLGWRMGYGKIRCNDKGTMNYKDDEWWWESPEGITQEIRLKPGTPDR